MMLRKLVMKTEAKSEECEPRSQGKGVFQEGASGRSTVVDVPGSLVGHSWTAPTAAGLEKSWCWGLRGSCLQAEGLEEGRSDTSASGLGLSLPC